MEDLFFGEFFLKFMDGTAQKLKKLVDLLMIFRMFETFRDPDLGRNDS